MFIRMVKSLENLEIEEENLLKICSIHVEAMIKECVAKSAIKTEEIYFVLQGVTLLMRVDLEDVKNGDKFETN